MQSTLLALALFTLSQAAPLGSGDHKRSLTVDGEKRTHLIHVPPGYDAKKPTAVVLVLHGALMDGKLMEAFCGLSKTADKHNFVAVYPNGTGPGGLFLTWNAGLFVDGPDKKRIDDVKYLGRVLDDIADAISVDRKRVYAAGLSNGAMMSFRLASEMSDRIAAIAPVAGTLAIDKYEPRRPVPVVMFHGTQDTIVPYDGPLKTPGKALIKFRSVPSTIEACLKANGCPEKPTVTDLDGKADKLKIIRKHYHPCKAGADVVLYVIEGGGHTWPGMTGLAPAFLGPTTRNISANEIMWEFFQKHPLP